MGGRGADAILDSGLLPHAVLRVGIRRQLAQRLAEIDSESRAAAYARKQAFLARLRTQPIAIATSTANAQHYEVGTGVLRAMLGPRMKYSACLYAKGSETLGMAEVAMLQSYSESCCILSSPFPRRGHGGGDTEIVVLMPVGCAVEKAGLKDGMSILDLG